MCRLVFLRGEEGMGRGGIRMEEGEFFCMVLSGHLGGLC